MNETEIETKHNCQGQETKHKWIIGELEICYDIEIILRSQSTGVPGGGGRSQQNQNDSLNHQSKPCPF